MFFKYFLILTRSKFLFSIFLMWKSKLNVCIGPTWSLPASPTSYPIFFKCCTIVSVFDLTLVWLA